PRLFGGVDHRHPDPVLHRAAGIEVLELRADLPVETGPEPLEQDQRRAADDGGGLGADPHRCRWTRSTRKARSAGVASVTPAAIARTANRYLPGARCST